MCLELTLPIDTSTCVLEHLVMSQLEEGVGLEPAPLADERLDAAVLVHVVLHVLLGLLDLAALCAKKRGFPERHEAAILVTLDNDSLAIGADFTGVIGHQVLH